MAGAGRDCLLRIHRGAGRKRGGEFSRYGGLPALERLPECPDHHEDLGQRYPGGLRVLEGQWQVLRCQLGSDRLGSEPGSVLDLHRLDYWAVEQ